MRVGGENDTGTGQAKENNPVEISTIPSPARLGMFLSRACLQAGPCGMFQYMPAL